MNTQARNRAGVLLHPTSLPSGQIDQAALDWIDWLARAGFSVWQVLPLGVPQSNRSPYMCLSSFALSPTLYSGESSQIDGKKFSVWYAQQRFWLDDYALFRVLKQQFSGQAWYEWPLHYRHRYPEALAFSREEHKHALLGIFRQQFRLWQRWQKVRRYARERGIEVFGDLPIFVAHDSADVWANQASFMLDTNGQPSYVAGVPPDYFSETGQRWGNPQYNWAELESSGFGYWMNRLRYHLQMFDLLRIDHFRGLEAVWMIEASSEGAVNGFWQEVPGDRLLTQVADKLGRLPLVAENLGKITEPVEQLRKRFQLPGMAVLQFGWDGSPDNPHLPDNIAVDNVVYTGTHDNDTTVGWFDNLEDEVQRKIMSRMGIEDAGQVCSAMIDAALGSEAELAIIPLQDLLELDTSARMNTPGTNEGNWQWQVQAGQLDPVLADSLKARLAHFKRGA